jgi:hypothetical protein
MFSAAAAIGLSLFSAAPAKAQYFYQQYYTYPNTAYTFAYTNPGLYGYYPYSSAYFRTPYYNNPAFYGYNPGLNTRYYHWDWYNPYTNQYRTWRWFRRF